jgi:hypothetical protein
MRAEVGEDRFHDTARSLLPTHRCSGHLPLPSFVDDLWIKRLCTWRIADRQVLRRSSRGRCGSVRAPSSKSGSGPRADDLVVLLVEVGRVAPDSVSENRRTRIDNVALTTSSGR